ncbi:galactoside-binding lectin [Nitzschia inconspicua]|uniref:Galactoside-binding lectin n=1 Tax=Nitzschia inconspicua TaxID=303405 RepID=A0A9K3KGL4_9STRA|nr:galactoside-binding lectin [Nitzschia inconspicua]
MAPPPGTWRSTPKAAEHAAKYNFNLLPEDFEFTAEEQNLIQMYDTVKQFEREATRLKEKKARERIYANNQPQQQQQVDDDDEQNDQDENGKLSPVPPTAAASAAGLASNKKRKAGRGKKKKASSAAGVMHDSSEEDENDAESAQSDADQNMDAITLAERRAAKLEALRGEVEGKKNTMTEEELLEEQRRKELLATNDDDGIDDGRVLKRKRPIPSQEEGKSLLSKMMTAQTPPHDFSEKLGLKTWKGTVLFPQTTDELTWSPPESASNPNDGAFLVPMENFDITKAQNGEGPNTLALKFTAPSDSKRFSFNIAGPGHEDFDSILFHFNPRQRQKGGQLVINDKQKGQWGRPVQLPLSQVPLIFGQMSVTLLVQINGDGFDIFIEGKHCARLEHRTELPSKPCTLYLQFPSCDDYGAPENWKVFKAWWGNKESMAKDDISSVAGVNTFDSVHPRKLFIQGLPKIRDDREVELRRAELERIFHRYGGARGVSTLVPKNVGYAFVEFETDQMCNKAFQEMADKYPFKITRARRSKHEALMDKRAAEAAAGNAKSAGDW